MLRFQGFEVLPDTPGFHKITGTYRRSSGTEFQFDFVIPDARVDWIAPHTDGWFLLGVTAAFTVGEDYLHEGAVSAELIRNCHSLVKQWHAFFPRRRLIKITHAGPTTSQSRPDSAADAPTLVACLYTGGVDSSFTLASKPEEIDLLVSAAFRFTPGDDYSYMPGVREESETAARTLGYDGLGIGNNLLSVFPEWGESWSYLTHGAALIGMCHLLSGRIRKVIISSSHAFGELIPWGSHPLTDALFSSSTMEVEHFGTTYSRYDKVSALASQPTLINRLSVCGRSPDDKNGWPNCSECQKCVRTMAALDLSGVDKQQCSSFDWDRYDYTKLSLVVLHHPNEYIFFEELIDAGRAAGRTELVAASTAAVRRSSKYKPLVAAEGYLRRSFPAVGRMRKLATFKKRFYTIVRGDARR